MKAFVFAIAAMAVIAFGANFTLNAVDRTAAEKYSIGDVPTN